MSGGGSLSLVKKEQKGRKVRHFLGVFRHCLDVFQVLFGYFWAAFRGLWWPEEGILEGEGEKCRITNRRNESWGIK
jgi:hypothetical protein